jgi:ABC-2 type transport system ATP-binding protein
MLETMALSKKYGSHTALSPLNLKVAAGEIFCLLGPNGAGKTTTVNLLLNFIQPTSGQALIGGLDVVKQPLETKRKLAYIPELVMLYKPLNGLENLAYFSELAGQRYRPQELAGFLQRAGLADTAHRQPVGSYSKGMRQKVGIAMALAKRAELLILDEPTSGLDPKASYEFSELLRSLAREGVAIFMVTHDLFRVKELGARVGILRAGHLEQELSTEDIGHQDLEQLYLNVMQTEARA